MSARLIQLKLRDWLDQPVTLRGFLGSLALPVSWLALFYTLVLHVRLSLGRWPHFGERFYDWLGFHERAVWLSVLPLYFSVYAATLVFIACLFFRRFRHVSIYAFGYAMALLLDAFAACYLAPGPFLNWFWD